MPQTERCDQLKLKSWLYPALGLGAVALAAGLLRKKTDLQGKLVLITGGSRGLGLQLARDFAAAGSRVVICARDEEELVRAGNDLRTHGSFLHGAICDVTSQEEVEELIRDTQTRFGPIDILVNNAGIIQVGPVENMDIADFENAMNAMFWGGLYATLAVLPSMKERESGTIVNITSIGGKVGIPHLAPYCAAKFATVGLSEALGAELRTRGIRVLTVIPGLMRTGSHLNANFKGRQDQEYRWFGLGATMPGMAMNATRASRQILSAVRSDSSQRILGLPANLLARAHGAFPEVTSEILAVANMALPKPTAGDTILTGKEAERKLDSPIHRKLTALGLSAAKELNEVVH